MSAIGSHNRQELIDKLSNENSISIARVIRDLLLDSIDLESLPPEDKQLSAFVSLVEENTEFTVDPNYDSISNNTDLNEIGISAKRWLSYISQNGSTDILMKLDSELKKFIDGKTASVDPLLALPIVLTCCIASLTLISGLKYKNGKLTIDPSKGTEVLKVQLSGMTDILKNLVPFKHKSDS